MGAVQRRLNNGQHYAVGRGVGHKILRGNGLVQGRGIRRDRRPYLNVGFCCMRTDRDARQSVEAAAGTAREERARSLAKLAHFIARTLEGINEVQRLWDSLVAVQRAVGLCYCILRRWLAKRKLLASRVPVRSCPAPGKGCSMVTTQQHVWAPSNRIGYG